jgi:sulfur-carrier protein
MEEQMARVRVPTQLRSITQGAGEVTAEGNTITDVIDDLSNRYEGLGNRLRDDSGELRRFINIYVDDEDIRWLEGLDTQVNEQTRVSIIPSVAGGRN